MTTETKTPPKRITADPNHTFEAMANQELAGLLSEAFTPLFESPDDQRTVNELADGIQREIDYQYYEGVARGRKVALEFLAKRFTEVADKMPAGFVWFQWVNAFISTGYQCCHRDQCLNEPTAFWSEVERTYNRMQNR